MATPSVRARLTLWYTLALASVLIAYATAVFMFLRHALYADMNLRLREDIELVREALEPTDDGRLVWRLARQPIDLLGLARDVATYLEDLAQEKGQRLDVEGCATVGVRGDWLVLRQAVINVVDNAIKYSPGGVSIRVGVALA
jgi:signal transduction histidine kinase